ncbi:hypothetical protein CPC16_010431 [Podila verticillata]|nr:hypothetical protein CPC16_010431 [Podila verticillata]
MAARFLDMALDDVAKSRSKDTRGPGNRRGGATRGGNSGRDSPARNNRSSPYNRNSPDDRWTHDKFDDNPKSGRTTGGNNNNNNNNTHNTRATSNESNPKIIVENLHYAVTLEDIKVLFETHAGPVKFAEVKYDLSGRSTGVATILFKVPGDAAVAIKKLNGVALDGQAMKIEYATPPAPRRDDRRAGSSRDSARGDVFSRLGSRYPSVTYPMFNVNEASIASRLGKANPLPKASGAQGSQSSSGHGSGRKQTKPQPKQTKQQTKPKTVEELDAEMDTYMGDA